MSKKVVTIDGYATVAEAVKLMREYGLSSLVVDRENEEDCYGIVTETDIVYKVAALERDPKAVYVYEIMSEPCIVVNPDLSVEGVAKLFANSGIRRAPVIQDKLLGFVSVTDILLRSDFVKSPAARREREIEKEIEKARQICAQQGFNSPECAAAWDIIEDLQAQQKFNDNRDREEDLEAEDFVQYDRWCCDWI